MACGGENKAADDMLRDDCFANTSDVSKECQSQKKSLLVINTLLHEDIQVISKKLDEQKKTSMELAGKDIENQKKIVDLQAKLDSLQNRFDNLIEEKCKIEHQLEQQKTAIGKERKGLCCNMEQKTNSHNEELKRETERVKNDVEKERALALADVELKKTRETNAEITNSLKAEINQLESDKEELLSRLSKLAGANLTHNNPNIANLSDMKRPTKLAEEFSELYDNEWTEAFEEIDAEYEEYKSKFLLELLKRTNQLCQDLSNNHTKLVKKSLSTLTLLIPTKQEQERAVCSPIKDKFAPGEQSHYIPECCDVEDDTGTIHPDKAANTARTKNKKLESDFENLQTQQKKTIMEATKFFEMLLSEDVNKAVMEVIINEKGIDEKEHKCVIAYLAKCIDLCWSMVRHTPPVLVDFADIAFDIPFDTNKYKPYTRTGRHLAYIVWPALYLHEGGPLLSKGVAQGK